jgi:hypothetical protein
MTIDPREMTLQMDTRALIQKFRKQNGGGDAADPPAKDLFATSGSTAPLPAEADDWFNDTEDSAEPYDSNRDILPVDTLSGLGGTLPRRPTDADRANSLFKGPSDFGRGDAKPPGTLETTGDVQVIMRRHFAPVLGREDSPTCRQCGKQFGTFRRRVRCVMLLSTWSRLVH